MGAMEFPKFMIYNVISGIVWVGVCMFAGVLLGGIPQVRENFEIAILVLVIISVLPIAIEVWLHKRRKKHKATVAAQEESSSS